MRTPTEISTGTPRAVKSRRILWLFVLLLLPFNAALAQQPLVIRLTLHDTIQPVTAAYVQRGLDEAARRHAALVIISLGTPGGLLESTRVMVQAIESSPTPVADLHLALGGTRRICRVLPA